MPFNLKGLVPGCTAKTTENGEAGQKPGRSASTCEGDPYGDGSEVRVRLSSEASGQHSSRRCSRHSTLDHDDGYGCAGTIVVTLLILSPPLVLIGVILLTTGAIISSAHLFGSGMAVIVAGVVLGALSAFAFVRLRSKTTVSYSSTAGRTSSLRADSIGEHRQLTPRSASIIEATDQRTVEITFCTSDPETTRDL